MTARRAEDARWMDLALALGRRTMGRTWPNPAVGCVIVRDGRVLGRGWTQPGGRPHAETEALARAGAAAAGATAYVTLEPCAHHGRTPPCTEALVAAGLARVVVAAEDPDRRVSGAGIERLRAEGIAVDCGCRAAEAARDHAGFFLRVTADRPWVTLKLALSADGRIATAAGESRWITGPQARRRVHAMRARHDAVMVGAGTALTDDPALDVRDMGIAEQPVSVVCDTGLRTPPEARLGVAAARRPVWLCHGDGAAADRVARWQATGARLLECVRGADGRVDPADMLGRLAAEGLTRVFCEGGGTLAASLLALNVVDELVVFGAGLVLGAEGRPAVGALAAGPLAAFPRFTLAALETVGADWMAVWRR